MRNHCVTICGGKTTAFGLLLLTCGSMEANRSGFPHVCARARFIGAPAHACVKTEIMLPSFRTKTGNPIKPALNPAEATKFTASNCFRMLPRRIGGAA